jgi:hypothetical protein
MVDPTDVLVDEDDGPAAVVSSESAVGVTMTSLPDAVARRSELFDVCRRRFPLDNSKF